ncbi:MAG: hypothetical protein ACREQV_04540 [Candidatus Binatia bacterium]
MFPNGYRRIIHVLVTHLSEVEYFRRWEERRVEYFAGLSYTNEEFPDLWDREEIYYSDAHPAAYPYNDLYGFYDVAWDGGSRIMCNSYYRADARRKAGKILKGVRGGRSLQPNSFYLLHHLQQLAWISLQVNEVEFERSLVTAVERIAEEARDFGGVAHVEEVLRLATATRWAEVASKGVEIGGRR